MVIGLQQGFRIAPAVTPPPLDSGAILLPNYGLAFPGTSGAIYDSSSFVAPSPLFTCSFWIRYPDSSVTANLQIGYWCFEGVKPGFSVNPVLSGNSYNYAYDLACYLTTNNGVPGDGTFQQLTFNTIDGILTPNATGHHIFISADTSNAFNKVFSVLVDGVDVTPTGTLNSNSNGINPSLNAYIRDLSGVGFSIGFGPIPPATAVGLGIPDTVTLPYPQFYSNTNAHYTEFWMACGQYVDPNDIGKFRNPVTGLPVFLGVDGSLPTGVKPTYYLTGPPTSFPINRANSNVALPAQGAIVVGNFNGFVDQNPATVFFPNGSGEYNGVFQSPCAAADSPFLTISMWVRLSGDANFVNYPNLLSFIADPNITVVSGSGADLSILTGGNTSGLQGDIGVYLAARSSHGTFQSIFSSGGDLVTPGVGHHIFISCDTNHAAGVKLFNIWIDGVNAIDPGQTVDASAAYNICFNGEFGIPDTAGFAHFVETDMDFAEVWVAPGVYLDPATNISKFRNPITGLPVELGQQGEIPTGTPPYYYFKGPWDQFEQNRGTGGACTKMNLSETGIPTGAPLPTTIPTLAISALGTSTWALPASTYPYPVPVLDLDFTTATYKIYGTVTPIASIITNVTQVRNNRLEVGIDAFSPRAPVIIDPTTIAYINGTGGFAQGSPTTGFSQGWGSFESNFTVYIEAQCIGPFPGTSHNYSLFDIFEWYSGAEIGINIAAVGDTHAFDVSYTDSRDVGDFVQNTYTGTPPFKVALTRTNAKLHMAVNGSILRDTIKDNFNGEQQDYWTQLPDPRLTQIYPPDPPGTNLNQMTTFNNFTIGGYAGLAGGGHEFNQPGDPDGGVYIFRFRIYPALCDRQLIALTT